MGRIALTIVLAGFALVLACRPAFSGVGGTVAGPAIDALLDTAHAIDKKALKGGDGVSKEQKDAVGEETKGAITRLAAMRNTRLVFGGLIRNVFFGTYFVTLYGARINGAKGAIGLLWDDARLLTSVIFTGEDLKDVKNAVRMGSPSLKMVLRDYYLTRHVDIDPSLSIVHQLARISLDAATGPNAEADIARIDLLPVNDRKRRQSMSDAYTGRPSGFIISKRTSASAGF